MRGRLAVWLAVVLGALLLVPAASARPAPDPDLSFEPGFESHRPLGPPAPLAAGAAAAKPLRCKDRKVGGVGFRLCGGQVRDPDRESDRNGLVASPDGTVLLDTDVTLPAKAKGPLPLVVFLHGLGGSREDFEATGGYDGPPLAGSERLDHNNLWWAKRGYAVLNYTARGLHTSECVDESIEASDGDVARYEASPACLTQLAHVDYEIKDTQFLVSRLIDGKLLDEQVTIARKIGVVGISYGGGQTWLLTRKNTWTTPGGVRVKVGAAAPVIGWTDLLDALAPNGRATDVGVRPTDLAQRGVEPVGVTKQSYVSAFYRLMTLASSIPLQLPGYFNAWYERFLDGEPFDGDEVVFDAVEKLLSERSAYYVKKGSFDTPILAVQGFTDQIFPAVQSLQMYERLTSGEGGYPMNLYLGDWGHPTAQNKPEETAYIAAAIKRWFDFYLKGKGKEPAGAVEARLVDCGDEIGALYRSGNWEGLKDGTTSSIDSSALAGLDGTLDSTADDPHATELNPANDTPGVDNSRCRVTDTEVAAGNLAATVELPEGLTMLGLPEMTLTADASAPEMYVAVRLWDVDQEGTQTLVDRGVVRLQGTEAQPVAFKTFGNAYQFEPGHSLKVELTANDSPAFAAPSDAAQGTIAISDAALTIPVADTGSLVAPRP